MAIDELVGGGEPKVWVGLLMLLIYVNSTYLWFMEGGASDELFGFEPWRLLAGVVAPALCPLIFFSVRGARASAIRDASRLCGLALPFMVVLALCALAWTHGGGRRWITRGGAPLPVHRHSNAYRQNNAYPHSSLYSNLQSNLYSNLYSNASIETPARFYPTAVQGEPYAGYLSPLCLLLSPFAAGAVLWQLVASVTEGFTSEFLSSLLWTLCIRHWVLNEGEGWFPSFVGVLTTGLGFVLILCFRRV